MRRLAALFAAALAVPAVALGAPPDSTSTDQISSSSRSVSTPGAGVGAPVVATEQIAGSASTAPPDEASTRGQGRVGLTTRAIGGHDRCADPHHRPADCANTIEQRSSDFAQPREPELTAEQRLLIQLQTGEDAEHRVQRGQPGQSQAADALAGALTQAPPETPSPASSPTTLDPAIQSAVDAAMGITVNVIPPSH